MGSSTVARQELGARSLMAREPDFGLPRLTARQIDSALVDTELASVEEQLLLDEEYAALMYGDAIPEPPTAPVEPSATKPLSTTLSAATRGAMPQSMAMATTSTRAMSSMVPSMSALASTSMAAGEASPTSLETMESQITSMVAATTAPSTITSSPPSMATEIIQIIEGF
ncbi:hypothetical protein OF83DRAFT_1167569 [Amylostereum chailletii]|nr:hypothetical protein OF83DRAFT_1167569 [Amylostereum chailletii]